MYMYLSKVLEQRNTCSSRHCQANSYLGTSVWGPEWLRLLAFHNIQGSLQFAYSVALDQYVASI